MKVFAYISAVLLWFVFFSCEKDFNYRGGEQGLEFSTDTVSFDTIFTSIGSTTQNFLIYNPYNEDLTISEIKLMGGDESSFRLNINGTPGNEVADIKLAAKDSMYVFVDVFIDPLQTNSPLVINDSIQVVTKYRTQKVKLEAYGQDVVLLKGDVLTGVKRFTNDKPYLIYDSLVVGSEASLTIEAGTRLHFHQNSMLLVDGQIEVNGSLEEPVKFLGDRLEEWYDDIPGQWGYISIRRGAGKSKFNYAEIRNSIYGLYVDSVGAGVGEQVILSNTIIEHIALWGLLGYKAGIDMSNCVIGDCGSYSLAIVMGGKYNVNHCTIANYYGWGTARQEESLVITNCVLEEDDDAVAIVEANPLIEANFTNCIIYGSILDEVALQLLDLSKYDDGFAGETMNYNFTNCVIRSSNPTIFEASRMVNVLYNEYPEFKDYQNYNYELDTLSVCKDYGDDDYAELVPFDLLGSSRLDDEGPDLGAYERIE